MVLEAREVYSPTPGSHMSEEAKSLIEREYPICQDAVARTCRGNSDSEVDAAEAEGQTWVNLCSSAGTFKENGIPFSHFACKIAHNTALNTRRSSRRRPAIAISQCPQAENTAALGLSPEERMLKVERILSLNEAINTLSETSQLVLGLRLAQALSHAQIGQIIGKSEVATKTIFSRALKRINDSPKVQLLKSKEND